MHDFAITETHAVFFDLPLIIDPSKFAKGEVPFVFKHEETARQANDGNILISVCSTAPSSRQILGLAP